MDDHSNIQESHLDLVKTLAAGLPKFNDGRIDYTTSAVAPVVNCIVLHHDRVLLLQRSERIGEGKGKWSGVAGYVDRLVPLEDIVLTELQEELEISDRDVARIAVADSYESDDHQANVKWIVFPVLVELKRLPDITLDWEHTQYRWIDPSEIHNFDILPGQDRVLRLALDLRQPD
jgi:ADP-ribose pyrophosphatase YjhB (NUDIX family)